jgi:tetratricopeptide (TPR) repeat protein
LFIFSIFYKSHEVLIVAYIVLAIFVFLEKSKKELISFFVVFSLFISGIVFKTNDLSDTSSMLSVFLLFEYFNKSKGQRTDYFYLVWLIPLFFNANGFVGVFQFVGFIIQYFLLALVIKYQNLKFVLLLAVGMFFLLFQEIELDYLLFLILLFFNESKFLEKINTSYFHLIFLVVISFLSLNQKENGEVNQVFRTKTKSISKIESKYSEGRELNFVENPLVNINDYQKKLIVGFETTGQYIKLLTLPYPLKFYYGYNVVNTDSKLSVASIVGFTFFCVFSFLVLYFSKMKNYNMLFFVFSTLLSFAMFSNWFVLVAGIIGERLVFEASLAFVFILVYLIYKLDFFSDLFKKIIFPVVIIFFSILTIVRNQEWKNPLTLMGNDIKNLQYSAQANNLYALNLMKICSEETSFSADQTLSMQKLAKKHLKRAVKIYPKFSNAWYDLSRVSLILNDTNNAIHALNQNILLNKKFPDSYVDLLSIYEYKNDRLNHLKYSRLYFKNINDSEAIIMMAKSFVANQKIDSAKIVLMNGLKRFKSNPRLISNINELNVLIHKNLTN